MLRALPHPVLLRRVRVPQHPGRRHEPPRHHAVPVAADARGVPRVRAGRGPPGGVAPGVEQPHHADAHPAGPQRRALQDQPHRRRHPEAPAPAACGVRQRHQRVGPRRRQRRRAVGGGGGGGGAPGVGAPHAAGAPRQGGAHAGAVDHRRGLCRGRERVRLQRRRGAGVLPVQLQAAQRPQLHRHRHGVRPVRQPVLQRQARDAVQAAHQVQELHARAAGQGRRRLLPVPRRPQHVHLHPPGEHLPGQLRRQGRGDQGRRGGVRVHHPGQGVAAAVAGVRRVCGCLPIRLHRGAPQRNLRAGSRSHPGVLCGLV
mmetsp:Transcript_29375/g.72699  ORF Transcript_29375/g.72699 Transcript_29375/m.72699 type:complete len:314 (+) Transcript_29375:534-1475(+)